MLKGALKTPYRHQVQRSHARKRVKPMAISKKQRKVIELAAYRRKPVTYEIDTGPEMVSPGDMEELVRQGRWMGTYTPPALYGKKDQGKEAFLKKKTFPLDITVIIHIMDITLMKRG